MTYKNTNDLERTWSTNWTLDEQNAAVGRALVQADAAARGLSAAIRAMEVAVSVYGEAVRWSATARAFRDRADNDSEAS